MSSKALESWILVSSGMSPVFKHSIIKGGNLNMAVGPSLNWKPSAGVLCWSSLFMSMQTAQFTGLNTGGRTVASGEWKLTRATKS